MSIRKIFIVLSILVFSIQAAGAASVSISGSAFQPRIVNIVAGTTVTWTNNDPEHTVTSNTGLFNSGILFQGQSFSFTFNTAGNFDYHCSIHTFMTGTVVVAQAAQVLTYINVTPRTVTITPGSTFTFTAVGFDRDGNVTSISQPVAWSVSNPSVGTITSINTTAGMFSALAAGTTLVNATSQNFTGSAFVTVPGAVANGIITGTVTNASSGAAIAGATVTTSGVTSATDANGTYTISVAAGTYTVTASATGYNSFGASVTIEPGATINQNFPLQPAAVSPIADPDVAKYDANNDGRIQKSEAVTALIEYFSNLITKNQAVKVIVAYFSST